MQIIYFIQCSRVSIITHKEYLNTNARAIDIKLLLE